MYGSSYWFQHGEPAVKTKQSEPEIEIEKMMEGMQEARKTLSTCGMPHSRDLLTSAMMTGILLDKLLVYYTDLYPTELNHNQQLANPNTLCR
jgi:hypothetical protein